MEERRGGNSPEANLRLERNHDVSPELAGKNILCAAREQTARSFGVKNGRIDM